MQRNKAAVLASMVMAIGALGACSKPASETASNAKDSATDVAAAGANATAGGMADAGGAVSPPSAAQNEPINTDTSKTETAQTPGSTSFTEGQAKGHIENAGYTDVSGLTKTADGFWTGSAKKDGKSVQVSVDYKGAVSAK
jgi:putative membrane protein